ncbi:hypothetical protein GCM10025771_37500 [Niveibacterium umoris]|uniref:Uncharacterized protein n=1 Tax=Niveibacterium umoris TaxID=1193620 RepID=A0A840BHH4_9RHOO|nr:hypothetical protein [Niveibacterium umoris]MBB4011052.1 hypothetical protein [Niveibacterium umoris]
MRADLPDTPSVVENAASKRGQELADAARADIGRISRDMVRQEAALDPSRLQKDFGKPRELPKDAVARALEKQFGRRLPFREESHWVDATGGMTWRIETELGAVCLKEMPVTATITAPGQGPGHELLVPMYCQ